MAHNITSQNASNHRNQCLNQNKQLQNKILKLEKDIIQKDKLLEYQGCTIINQKMRFKQFNQDFYNTHQKIKEGVWHNIAVKNEDDKIIARLKSQIKTLKQQKSAFQSEVQNYIRKMNMQIQIQKKEREQEYQTFLDMIEQNGLAGRSENSCTTYLSLRQSFSQERQRKFCILQQNIDKIRIISSKFINKMTRQVRYITKQFEHQQNLQKFIKQFQKDLDKVLQNSFYADQQQSRNMSQLSFDISTTLARLQLKAMPGQKIVEKEQ